MHRRRWRSSPVVVAIAARRHGSASADPVTRGRPCSPLGRTAASIIRRLLIAPPHRPHDRRRRAVRLPARRRLLRVRVLDPSASSIRRSSPSTIDPTRRRLRLLQLRDAARRSATATSRPIGDLGPHARGHRSDRRAALPGRARSRCLGRQPRAGPAPRPHRPPPNRPPRVAEARRRRRAVITDSVAGNASTRHECYGAANGRPGIRPDISTLRGRQPRGAGDRAVTRRPMRSYPATGRPHMLRLQAPLPDDYTLATDDELVARIAAAKAALGDRLADPRPPLPARRGDPLGRPGRRLVQARPLRGGQRPGDRHRVLRRALHGRVGRRAHRRPPAGDPPRPQRRLLDGRHGRTSTRSRRRGTRSPASPRSTASCRSRT